MPTLPRKPKIQINSDVLKMMDEIAEKYYGQLVCGYITVDDAKQEIRMLCLKAMEDYDKTKGTTLRTWFVNKVLSRSKNFKRDRFFRLENPCKSCPFFDIWEDGCHSEEREFGCQKVADYNLRVDRSISLAKNASFPDELPHGSDNVLSGLIAKEKIDEIREVIRRADESLVDDLEVLMTGGNINRFKKKKIEDILVKYFLK